MASKSRKPSKKQMSDEINAKFALIGVDLNVNWSKLDPQDLAQVHELAMGIEEAMTALKEQMFGEKKDGSPRPSPAQLAPALRGSPFMRNRPFLRMLAENRGEGSMPIMDAARETAADGIREIKSSGAIRKALQEAFLSEGKIAKKVAEQASKKA